MKNVLFHSPRYNWKHGRKGLAKGQFIFNWVVLSASIGYAMYMYKESQRRQLAQQTLPVWERNRDIR